ncbi:ammonium transporter [Caldicellulosiruptor acetigenus]|uniref:ammonium transporter n=1 Tax=Caldicellulosiruptor acetigenus TaxID=301953 RepID=UPI00042165C0|nr:ammonium transporter [Caldicellulosiruptor acetigenus]WAM35813.1 ammonium transporter [Caldicellulosiruptor acetigenus]
MNRLIKNYKAFLIPVGTIATLLLVTSIAKADQVTPDKVAIAVDNVWVLVTAFLVFFMQAGFAMVEAGFTRAKNASNIVMKNLMDFAIGSVIFWLFGFAFMFGKDAGGFIGTSGFFLSDSFKHLGLSIPLTSFLIFQTVFAATAATIVSGAMAERTKFIAYCIYSAVISFIIYPVVGHWAWGGGWLSKLGFIDFAGSTVVHSVGGWSALIGAALLGPRIGKYTKDGKVNAIPGHSITLAALGTFILWFGWFGFNPGSTLSGMNEKIGDIAVNTNLAAAMGANLAMIYTWLKYKKPDVSMTLNGALAGLVAITAGCASVNPWGAAIIGGLAGILVVVAVEFIDKKLKIDDPVGAISVHGVCGAFGTLMVGLFALDGGLFYGGGIKQFLVQLAGVASTFVWTTVTAFILFAIIKITVGLRVSEEEEIEGLDVAEHGATAYSDFVMKSQTVK